MILLIILTIQIVHAAGDCDAMEVDARRSYHHRREIPTGVKFSVDLSANKMSNFMS